MLNSTHPHSVIFNDVIPWWNIIYDATFVGDFYQAYYSDTINASYQGLVQAYAGLEVVRFGTLLVHLTQVVQILQHVIMMHKH